MDDRGSGRLFAALGLIALAILLDVGPAGAHSAGARLVDVHVSGSPRPIVPPGLPLGGLLAAGLILVAALGRRGRLGPRLRGRAIAGALVLTLSLFAFETAVHSVHHLADPESGANCPVFSGSENLSRGAVELISLDRPPLTASDAPLLRSESKPRSQLDRSSWGRAPPA